MNRDPKLRAARGRAAFDLSAIPNLALAPQKAKTLDKHFASRVILEFLCYFLAESRINRKGLKLNKHVHSITNNYKILSLVSDVSHARCASKRPYGLSGA